ncbi:MAG TPA: hypothetical protein VFT59_05890 [Candidatus Saccharimonadales bacterium]|nr:hypothetical protein [Candidatus Saccharimonadales bacterium]
MRRTVSISIASIMLALATACGSTISAEEITSVAEDRGFTVIGTDYRGSGYIARVEVGTKCTGTLYKQGDSYEIAVYNKETTVKLAGGIADPTHDSLLRTPPTNACA